MRDKKAQEDNFSSNLKALLKERGVSQRDLAEAINVTPAMVNRYIKQGIRPNLDTVQKIADFLSVSFSRLFSSVPMTDNDIPLDEWKFRALAAEKKLAQLKQVVGTLTKIISG